MRFGGALQLLYRHGEIRLGFRDRPAYPGHDFHGGLHQLVPYLGMLAAFVQAGQPGEHRGGVLAQHPRLRVDEVNFPFHAKRRAR